jgi:DNA-directed RNA polymerase subunit L
MELRVLEKRPEMLRMEVVGESHTLLNLLTEYAWEAKASQASYIIRHPYLSQPELIVKSKNPKKTVSDAAQIIIDRAKEFRHGFERALKR